MTSGPVLGVAPSNKILRKWVFPLKFKEKILVKIKVIQKASYLNLKVLGVRTRTFKRLQSFFSSGENEPNMKKCVAHNA